MTCPNLGHAHTRTHTRLRLAQDTFGHTCQWRCMSTSDEWNWSTVIPLWSVCVRACVPARRPTSD